MAGQFSNFPKSPTKGRNGLPMIQTHHEICHDDSAPPVKAQTIDQLHSLQKKKSAPNTPIKGSETTTTTTVLESPKHFSEEERQKQQLQSISASLASLTRETGPKVVRGDPSETPRATTHHHHHHHHQVQAPTTSDSALKFTHILYNLSPAGTYRVLPYLINNYVRTYVQSE